MTMVVLCGLPGAGKTILGVALSRVLGGPEGAQLISMDDLAPEWRTDLAPVVEERHREAYAIARRRALSAAEAALAHGRTVIVDDTNHLASMRRAWAQLAKQLNCTHIFLYVEATEATVKERNAARPPEERLSPERLASLCGRFEPPTTTLRPFERFLTITTSSSADVADLVPTMAELFRHCRLMLDSARLLTVADPTLPVTSRPTHDYDIALRRLVSEHIARLGPARAAEVNQLRRSLLDGFRRQPVMSVDVAVTAAEGLFDDMI